MSMATHNPQKTAKIAISRDLQICILELKQVAYQNIR